MRRFVLILLMLAGAAHADDWQQMTGEEIQAALTGKKLQYEVAWQDFRASGRTLYNAGEDSWGYWRVEGDQYCSQWPPRAEWDCYDMQTNGKDVRFVGAYDDITVGVFVE